MAAPRGQADVEALCPHLGAVALELVTRQQILQDPGSPGEVQPGRVHAGSGGGRAISSADVYSTARAFTMRSLKGWLPKLILNWR